MIEIIGTLAVPSGIIAVLILVSLLLAPLPRTHRLSARALMASAVVYAVFGFGPVAYALLSPLEQAYKPLTDLSRLAGIDWIVVLTGFAAHNDQLPPGDQLNQSSAYRVLHSVWMAAHRPEPMIAISGSSESAAVMRDVTVALGVASARVKVGNDADDTGQSAVDMKTGLNGESCVLVTSAGHMPRAMGAFKRQGIDCLPAPVEYYTFHPLTFFDYLPSLRNLMLSDLAVHEYLGLIWYRLRGRI